MSGTGSEKRVEQNEEQNGLGRGWILFAMQSKGWTWRCWMKRRVKKKKKKKKETKKANKSEKKATRALFEQGEKDSRTQTTNASARGGR